MNEAKSKRRLNLAGRQLTLAKIARREAMAALADAVTEEARSTALAARSHDLLSEYSRRLSATTGASLRGNAGFVGRLQEVADKADQASKDASKQAQWQVQALAAAETRKTRFEERMASGQREMESIKEAREHASAAGMAGGMARKLQSRSKAAGDT